MLMTTVSELSTDGRRFLHLYLPRLPIDEARRSLGTPWTGPAAVVAKVKNAQRLVSLDTRAEALGLEIGLALADARARVPELDVVEADPGAVAHRLETLADACRRYTPAVALDAPDGVHLDIGGCAHLFGGEQGLADDLIGRLNRAGFEGRFGVGDTPGIAWALSHHAPGRIAAPGRGAEALGPLPPAALGLDEDTAGVLGRLGIRTVTQLLGLSRASLARRFGENVPTRLDEVLGVRSAPLLVRLEAVPHRAEQRLVEPIAHEEAVLRWVRILAERLAPRLEGERQGGRRFLLDLFRVDGAVKRLMVEVARPLRDPARLAVLFAERLSALNDGLEADYGFDVLRLTADRLEVFEPDTLALVAEHGPRDSELAAFVDRVEARLGPGRVARPAPDPRTRIPELAARSVAFAAAVKAKWSAEPQAAYDGAALRPLRLFEPPERIEVIAQAPEGVPVQFRWRRVARRVVKGEGPERLAPEWWRAGAGALTRDYYRVEDREGRRYWLFRQGLFAEMEADRMPAWFVHGLFA